MKPKMELLVWVGDFGLISMNMECVRLIIYIKLANAPVNLRYVSNPYTSFCGDYPIFRHGSIILTDVADIINYLRLHDYAVDYRLSGKQISDTYALSNLLSAHLRPFFYYIFWIDQKNYKEFTRLWYSVVLPLPFKVLYCRKMQKYSNALIQSLYPREDDMEQIELLLRKNAMDCFNCLSTRLGHKEFFYGNTPTSLDAMVYAYLAPLVKIPFPSKQLTKLVNNFPVLTRYVKRLDQRVFPDLGFQKKYIIESSTHVKNRHKDDDDFYTAFGTKLFVCLATAFVMIGYAAFKDVFDFERFRELILGE